jgi:hypothetical protein
VGSGVVGKGWEKVVFAFGLMEESKLEGPASFIYMWVLEVHGGNGISPGIGGPSPWAMNRGSVHYGLFLGGLWCRGRTWSRLNSIQ